MLHAEIENEEIVERYVRNQLPPEQRQAFEEHLMDCDECFEKLQTADRFVAGMRDAAERGLLDGASRASMSAAGAWFPWALAAASCAALVVSVWIYRVEVPNLRGELERTTAQLMAERQVRAHPEQAPVDQAEANVPLVILQASRADEEPASVVLPPGAKRLVLWIEIGSSRYRSFRLDVFSQANQAIASLDHLERGPYGALAAGLPADRLTSGDFRIRLDGQDPLPASLVGEYHLRIRKP